VVDAALIAAAEAAADVAGPVIRPFFRAAGLVADAKRDASPVTIADRTAEQAMRAVLRERFPEFGILGEEFGLERPEARLRWVLDPIDGTRAFITGRPLFGTLVGLLDDGVPVLGIIDQPVSHERWIGVAGRPTKFHGFAGEAGCRACATLDLAELSCTSPEMFSVSEWARWEKLRKTVRRTTFGGDCYSYGLLALGHIDVIAEADLKVWDWTALLPVIEGAGGRMTDWQGQPLRAPMDASAALLGVPGPVLAVGDAALLPQAVQVLAE
jgi:histidinol phosphatase-like enzyme (inositol monophosphatase family)